MVRLLPAIVTVALITPLCFGAERTYSYEGVSFAAPKGIAVEQRVRVDFSEFYLSKAKRPLMFCYIGRAPEFPHQEKAKVTTEKIGQYTCKAVHFAKNDKHSGEYLLSLPDKDLPKWQHFTNIIPAIYIHVLYSDLRTDELLLVHNVIKSVKR